MTTTSRFLPITLLSLTSGLGCSAFAEENYDIARASLARDVGLSCVPADETFPDFRGFDADEVNYSDGPNSGCDVGGCMAYHFQGRVSCPEGQEAADGGCLTPEGESVTAPVQAQLESAPADSSVFCSCRCDGPEEAEPFCTCPSGFTCEPVFDSVGLSLQQNPYTGSYCVDNRAIPRSPPGMAATQRPLPEPPPPIPPSE